MILLIGDACYFKSYKPVITVLKSRIAMGVQNDWGEERFSPFKVNASRDKYFQTYAGL